MEDKLRAKTKSVQESNSIIQQLTRKALKLWCNNSNILNYSCFIFGLMCAFTYCFFGLDISDGPFFLNQYTTTYLTANDWLVFGNRKIISILTLNLPNKIIIFRFLNVIFHITTITLCLIPFRKHPCFKNKWGYVFLLSLLFTTNVNHNVLSPDSLSNLLTALVFCTGYQYYALPKFRQVFFLSLISAVNITVKFPNICIILPILVIFLSHGKNNKLLHCSIYLILTFIIYYSFYYLSNSHYSNISSVENHGIKELLIRSATSIFEITILGILVYFIIMNTRLHTYVQTILLVCIYLYLFNNWFGANIGNSLSQSIFILVPSILYLTNNSKLQGGFLIFITLNGLTTIAGSNTGALKLAHGFAFLLPTIFFATSSNSKMNLVFFLLLVTNLTNKFFISGTYQDYRIPKILKDNFYTKPIFSHPKTQFILTSNSRQQMICSELKFVRQNSDTNTILIGSEQGQLMKYLLGDSISIHNSYEQCVTSKQATLEILNTIRYSNYSKIIISKTNMYSNILNSTLVRKNYQTEFSNQMYIVLKKISSQTVM
jgi:hypothetical protein